MNLSIYLLEYFTWLDGLSAGTVIIGIIDVLLVASLLYYLYRLMKETGSMNIFYGIMILVTLWLFVARGLEMKLMGAILDQLMNVGTIALVVIFQKEIRRFFKNLGSRGHFRRITKYFTKKEKDEKAVGVYNPIIDAVFEMGSEKVGALILIERTINLNMFADKGVWIDASISKPLVENIFFKNSPLHDGAMLVQNGRISVAACQLPLADDLVVPLKLGLRHRSAISASMVCDAVIIIVSEETGAVSVAINGSIERRLTRERLEEILYQEN